MPTRATVRRPDRYRCIAIGDVVPTPRGRAASNVAFAGHALDAGIVALGGALQLIPQVRARFPCFHRWNGRVFLVTELTLSLSGFYLVWIRGTSEHA